MTHGCATGFARPPRDPPGVSLPRHDFPPFCGEKHLKYTGHKTWCNYAAMLIAAAAAAVLWLVWIFVLPWGTAMHKRRIMLRNGIPSPPEGSWTPLGEWHAGHCHSLACGTDAWSRHL